MDLLVGLAIVFALLAPAAIAGFALGRYSSMRSRRDLTLVAVLIHLCVLLIPIVGIAIATPRSQEFIQDLSRILAGLPGDARAQIYFVMLLVSAFIGASS